MLPLQTIIDAAKKSTREVFSSNMSVAFNPYLTTYFDVNVFIAELEKAMKPPEQKNRDVEDVQLWWGKHAVFHVIENGVPYDNVPALLAEHSKRIVEEIEEELSSPFKYGKDLSGRKVEERSYNLGYTNATNIAIEAVKRV